LKPVLPPKTPISWCLDAPRHHSLINDSNTALRAAIRRCLRYNLKAVQLTATLRSPFGVQTLTLLVIGLLKSEWDRHSTHATVAIEPWPTPRISKFWGFRSVSELLLATLYFFSYLWWYLLNTIQFHVFCDYFTLYCLNCN
jgi:hypothetical protein